MTVPTPPLTWQSTCGSYAVRIKPRAMRSMLRLAQEHFPHEVGTSLVGSYSDDGNLAIVQSLAPLTADSRGSRFSFLRGVLGLPEFFSRVYRRFSGHRHYVGEWHSHPRGQPIASATDDRNQAAIASDPAADCPECILVIVGGRPEEAPGLGVYVYSRERGRLDLHSV